MAQLINEAKRFQKLAGIIKEAQESVNENASYTVHLKIDGKTVMSRTSDSNLDEKEMSDNLTALESKYKDKYDFNKAEIVVLDPSGKQVGSLTKKDQKLMQWPYTGGSNFGNIGSSGFYEGKVKRMQQLADIINEAEATNPAVEKKIEDNVEKVINSSQAQATLQKMADQLSDEEKQNILKFVSGMNESLDLGSITDKLMSMVPNQNESDGPEDPNQRSTFKHILGQFVYGAPVLSAGLGILKGISLGGGAAALAAVAPTYFGAAAAGAVLIGLYKIIKAATSKKLKPSSKVSGVNIIRNN